MRAPVQLVAAAAAMFAAGTAVAQERLLVQHLDLLAVADREVACGQPLPVTLRAAEPAFFDDGERLQRTIDGLRAMLGFECARLPRLDITGEAGRDQRVVFRGTAGDGTAWLVERQGSAAVSESAGTGTKGGPLSAVSQGPGDGSEREIAGVRLGMTVEEALNAAAGSFGERPTYREDSRVMQVMSGGCDFRFDAGRAPEPGWRCLEGAFSDGAAPRLHTVGLAQAVDLDQRKAIEASLVERFGPPEQSVRRDDADANGGHPFLYLAWGDVLSGDRGSRLGFIDAPLRKLEAYAEFRGGLTVVNIWHQDPAVALAAAPDYRPKF